MRHIYKRISRDCNIVVEEIEEEEKMREQRAVAFAE